MDQLDILLRGGLLAIAAGLLLPVALAIQGTRRPYALGVATASAALFVLWAIPAFLAFFGSALRPSVHLLLFTPTIEELARTYAVFAVLPKFAASWRGPVAFAAGYALVESVYKILILVVSLRGHVDGEAARAMLVVGLTPFSFLFFLGVLMCLMKSCAFSSSTAFFISVALHAAYNAWGALGPAQDSWTSLYADALVRLLVCVTVSAIVVFALTRREGATRKSDTHAFLTRF